MSSLIDILSEVAGAAFEAQGLPAELGRVQVSDRPDLAQFQCNGALAAAKQAKKNPREIATVIVSELEKDERFSEITIAGPGFVNLKLTDAYIAGFATEIAADDRFGLTLPDDPRTVVLDYGGPNVAKPMHVGHLRAAIIGDAMRRIANFAGDNTIGDVHLGDWGTQMGQLISEIEIRSPELPYFDESFTGLYPEESPVSLEDLEEIYPAASAACKADEDRADVARLATAELQKGRPGYRALWQHFVDVSIAAIKREYEALGVHFDLWNGEASVNDLITPMIEDLKAKGLAFEDDGALIINVEKNDDKSEIPPLLLLKRDGSVMYGTTDVATIIDRVEQFDPDSILYVVDQRQHLHFEQVFRVVAKGNLGGKSVCEHLGFGTVNGKDGKPFKTREGGVMKLADLIQMAEDQAFARLDEAGLAKDCPEEERRDIAHKVGIAAIKFADLSNYRTTNYVFDLERFTTFEGKTGPYLQYQAVRIKSLLRKARDAGHDWAGAKISVEADAERDLALKLAGFSDAVLGAYEKRAPNYLCDFVYTLSQAFSRFYTNHHILSEEDEALRASRLALCELTLGELEAALDLLGIEVPERM